MLCALLTGCHAGTSRPELPEMVEYSGPNASSLRTFIESIEVIKLDHRESITVGAYNAIRSDSNSFYVGDMLNGSNLVYRFDRKGEFLATFTVIPKQTSSIFCRDKMCNSTAIIKTVGS